MTPQVLAAMIAAFGVLSGVVTGSFLSGRHQRRALTLEQQARSNDERRKIFSAFLTSAREWRSTMLHVDATFVDVSAVGSTRHADGGPAVARTLGLRSEIAIVAQPPTIRAAFELVRTLGELAKCRAAHGTGTMPQEPFVACRKAEVRFAVAAREDLGFAGSEAELEEIFLGVARDDPLPGPRRAADEG